ncbi:hypothetical protein FBY10_104332 [Pseudomonas sp. SJZ103]|jgi:hypothetical protein|nr:hypothetical protein [Pseudomonas sp. BIGb0381]TWC70930.1 hypothetical protein FBY10_104332 [Pseudomonas sp. SJZ103]TWC88469.1 hypothetical protein FBY08_103332 [Pseudomonas sp. SJZ094]
MGNRQSILIRQLNQGDAHDYLKDYSARSFDYDFIRRDRRHKAHGND